MLKELKMMGSFISRGLIMVFGYAYPAYECFKVVEANKPQIDQLMIWCQYWLLVAMLTVCERIGDNLMSWLPMYNEAKLAFLIYLWYSKMKGTLYVYNCFFQPFLAKHESKIDRSLLELKVKGGEIALLYWRKVATYGQTKFFEALQYVSSQSASQPHSVQQGTTVTSEELPASNPISPSNKEHNFGQPNASLLSQQQQQQPGSELENLSTEPALSYSSLQEMGPKESVRSKHVRWRLFRNTTSH